MRSGAPGAGSGPAERRQRAVLRPQLGRHLRLSLQRSAAVPPQPRQGGNHRGERAVFIFISADSDLRFYCFTAPSCCGRICKKGDFCRCEGHAGGRAVQVRRGGVRVGQRQDPALRGETAGLRLQQDQRRHVHLQSQHARQDPGNALTPQLLPPSSQPLWHHRKSSWVGLFVCSSDPRR